MHMQRSLSVQCTVPRVCKKVPLVCLLFLLFFFLSILLRSSSASAYVMIEKKETNKYAQFCTCNKRRKERNKTEWKTDQSLCFTIIVIIIILSAVDLLLAVFAALFSVSLLHAASKLSRFEIAARYTRLCRFVDGSSKTHTFHQLTVSAASHLFSFFLSVSCAYYVSYMVVLVLLILDVK